MSLATLIRAASEPKNTPCYSWAGGGVNESGDALPPSCRVFLALWSLRRTGQVSREDHHVSPSARENALDDVEAGGQHRR